MAVGQTCRKFNEVSCSIKHFKLEFKSLWNDSYTKMLDDDDIFKSMMKSQRKISSLKILSESFDDVEMNSLQLERLAQVIKYFNVNIKSFELNGNLLSMEILKLLNLMPNIEKICLTNIEDKLFEVPDGFLLSLNKLKEVESVNCSENVLNYLKILPDGVLKKLDLSEKEILSEANHKVELFTNQYNLKEIIINSHFIKLMNLKPISLTSLRLHGPNVSLQGTINGQHKLTSFVAQNSILENDLKLICRELKSLDELELLIIETQSSEFAELSKLSKLKKLKVHFANSEDSTLNESLILIESRSLQDLNIYSYRNELLNSSLISIGLSCPKLNKLKINSRSTLNIMHPIISYFPFLTDLELHGLMDKPENPFVFQGHVHNNLKILIVMGLNGECRDFTKLISSLQNLEKLTTSIPVSGKMLEELLTTTQPQLKLLDLSPQWNLMSPEHKTTKEFVSALKEFGTNLEVFRGQFHSLFSDMIDETLREEFRPLYTTVDISDGFAVVEWLLKK